MFQNFQPKQRLEYRLLELAKHELNKFLTKNKFEIWNFWIFNNAKKTKILTIVSFFHQIVAQIRPKILISIFLQFQIFELFQRYDLENLDLTKTKLDPIEKAKRYRNNVEENIKLANKFFSGTARCEILEKHLYIDLQI